MESNLSGVIKHWQHQEETGSDRKSLVVDDSGHRHIVQGKVMTSVVHIQIFYCYCNQMVTVLKEY